LRSQCWDKLDWLTNLVPSDEALSSVYYLHTLLEECTDVLLDCAHQPMGGFSVYAMGVRLQAGRDSPLEGYGDSMQVAGGAGRDSPLRRNAAPRKWPAKRHWAARVYSSGMKRYRRVAHPPSRIPAYSARISLPPDGDPPGGVSLRSSTGDHTHHPSARVDGGTAAYPQLRCYS
jgi:hypothetical protein